VIGAMPTVTAGNQVVVFNLGSGFTGADAWAASGNNRATVGSVAGSTITLSAAKVFPFESPGRRFHVVEGPITYECDLATGVIRRYWGYAISASQATPPSGGSNALLASRVTDCGFAYNANELLQRYGTVSLRLAVTAESETATLFAQAHVPNIP
jgi:MSHA biogenesis protein MshO